MVKHFFWKDHAFCQTLLLHAFNWEWLNLQIFLCTDSPWSVDDTCSSLVFSAVTKWGLGRWFMIERLKRWSHRTYLTTLWEHSGFIWFMFSPQSLIRTFSAMVPITLTVKVSAFLLVQRYTPSLNHKFCHVLFLLGTLYGYHMLGRVWLVDFFIYICMIFNCCFKQISPPFPFLPTLKVFYDQ